KVLASAERGSPLLSHLAPVSLDLATTSEDGSILGGSGPLDMNIVSLPKMDAAQLDQLGLNGHAGTLSTSGLTSLAANPQQYAPASSGSTQAILERVIAQGPRALSNVSPAVTFTTAGSSAQDSYGSLEYVTQMPLQDDQQAKFPDTLVSVDNVAFVDMNDAAIKGATASTPLELYFDVMNPTTTAAPTTSSGHHVRHEHQNPKSQLLERAYSDIFLQQQEQQQQQQQTQDQEPEHILPDVTTANLLVKVEAMVIGTDYEEEDPMEEVMEEDDPLEDEMDSNDEDPETSGNYSTDGKKSLPHKKRIPKKLKTTKKHVKCYKCAQCGEQFTNQQQFAAHKQTHTPPPMKPKPFKCEICAKGFDSQLKFFEHLKIHYEPYKKHKCEVCSGEFESADALQEHSLVHSREHFTCELCNKTFRKESMLEVHLKVAHMEEEETNSIDKPYTCVACPKSYRTQMALDSHVQSEHSENPPEFNCEDCYRVFKSKTKLVTHRKTEHKEEGPQNKGAPKKKIKIGKAVKGGYACSICPRVFTHKNSLVYHIRGHTGERPHPCPDCGKPFRVRSDMKRHRQTHMRDAAGSGSGVGTPASGHVNQGGTQSPSPAAQVVPGTISQANSQPQLILSDQVSVPGNVDQPIRIMVSSLNAQQVTTAVHPPPAHRQSQHVTVPVSGNIATLTTGPVSPGGTTTTLSPEVIIMDDNTHQPINLNIIPRMITQEQVASSPHTSHATLVTTEEEYLANSGRNTLEVRGEEGSVYVWHGVFTD
ncbi:Zinc finger and SCAN domain-containing protein 12-like, partial [Homarus americanus]